MRDKKTANTAFPLGRVVITRSALGILSPEEMRTALARHAAGDWGNVGKEDAAENQRSLANGWRLLSAYGEGDRRFWIITEADRSATTVLMPDDY